VNDTVGWNRRDCIQAAGAACFAAALSARAAEPPPETTRIRIPDTPVTCFAPLYVAEALLKAEGFSEVEYVKTTLNQGRTRRWPAAMSTSLRTMLPRT
jgi:ABC-type nitrate/sulfonate/bicarbonate transport system substrate-binding protein